MEFKISVKFERKKMKTIEYKLEIVGHQHITYLIYKIMFMTRI